MRKNFVWLVLVLCLAAGLGLLRPRDTPEVTVISTPAETVAAPFDSLTRVVTPRPHGPPPFEPGGDGPNPRCGWSSCVVTTRYVLRMKVVGDEIFYQARREMADVGGGHVSRTLPEETTGTVTGHGFAGIWDLPAGEPGAGPTVQLELTRAGKVQRRRLSAAAVAQLRELTPGQLENSTRLGMSLLKPPVAQSALQERSSL